MARFAAGHGVPASQLNVIDLLALADQDYVSGATETTGSTSYTDLATVGPSVTITSLGTRAVVFIQVVSRNSTSLSDNAATSVAVSGDTILSAADNEADGLVYSANVSTSSSPQGGCLHLLTINPGTNTYTMKYKAVTGGLGAFNNRKILVLAP